MREARFKNLNSLKTWGETLFENDEGHIFAKLR